jgi:hypothetical protein
MVTENRNTSILDVAMPVAQSLLLPFALPSHFGHRQILLLSSLLLLYRSSFFFFFFFFFIPPPSLLFAPFFFIN